MLQINTSIICNTTWMGSIECNENWMHFARQSSDVIVFFIVQGEMFLEIEGVRHHLKANEMVTIMPYEHHVGYQQAACVYYYLHFNNTSLSLVEFEQQELMETLLKIRRGWFSDETNHPFVSEQGVGYFPSIHLFSSAEPLVEITKHMDECIYKLLHSFPYYKIEISLKTNVILLAVIKSYLNDMLDITQQRKKKSFQQIYTIIGFINQNYKLHIDRYMIEKLTNLNYDYINREFKKSTTKTIMEYLTTVRIDKAKSFAVSSSYHFYEIGELVGYENQYYFSKSFKAETGMTISEYVKNHMRNISLGKAQGTVKSSQEDNTP